MIGAKLNKEKKDHTALYVGLAAAVAIVALGIGGMYLLVQSADKQAAVQVAQQVATVVSTTLFTGSPPQA
jgi:uncharacterized protein (UPF0333 family)